MAAGPHEQPLQADTHGDIQKATDDTAEVCTYLRTGAYGEVLGHFLAAEHEVASALVEHRVVQQRVTSVEGICMDQQHEPQLRSQSRRVDSAHRRVSTVL